MVRVLDSDHFNVLTTRDSIAFWTGESGNAKGALALFQKLLPDQERVLGSDHPNVLRTRDNIAFLAARRGGT